MPIKVKRFSFTTSLLLQQRECVYAYSTRHTHTHSRNDKLVKVHIISHRFFIQPPDIISQSPDCPHPPASHLLISSLYLNQLCFPHALPDDCACLVLLCSGNPIFPVVPCLFYLFSCKPSHRFSSLHLPVCLVCLHSLTGLHTQYST